MVVKPFMTFRELKYQAFKMVHIPMFLQKWIINDRTPEYDKQYMADLDVTDCNCNTFFLIKDKSKIPEASSEDTNNNAARPEPKYEDLVKLSCRPIVCNFEYFQCIICYTDINPGEGVTLQSCLHSFCKECLVNTIKFNEEITVNCPFKNDDFQCEAVLQEREIKSLLTTELWEKHLEKSVRLAQGSIENAYSCRTPNCKGWCIFENDINEFTCPICNAKNCLMCRAIHPQYTCRQYQDIVTGSDVESRAELQRLVDRGEAMYCPKCKVSTYTEFSIF